MKNILFFVMVFVLNINQISATDYYVATTTLNVRIEAGTKYVVSFTLQKGDEVEILSKKGNWCQIRYLEKTGLIINILINIDKKNNFHFRHLHFGSRYFAIFLYFKNGTPQYNGENCGLRQ